jgi:hypothetical protein
LYAASIGIVAGITDLSLLVSRIEIFGYVQRADWDVRGGFRISGCGFYFFGNSVFPDPENPIQVVWTFLAPRWDLMVPGALLRACALG